MGVMLGSFDSPSPLGRKEFSQESKDPGCDASENDSLYNAMEQSGECNDNGASTA